MKYIGFQRGSYNIKTNGGTEGNMLSSIPLADFKCMFSTGSLFIGLLLMFASCSVSNQLSRQATKFLLKDSAISTGHIGISMYEPATNRYWYNYNATKYFVPASNTKLFSLYAGLKYLGDSLPGIRYEIENDSAIRIQPTGDPSFLHPGFLTQPVFDFLSRFKTITFTSLYFTENFVGMGWAWDDYKEAYMTQRSNFPIYSNLTTLQTNGQSITILPATQKYLITGQSNLQKGFAIEKKWDENIITISSGSSQRLSVPFTPHALDIVAMLQDTLHRIVLPDAVETRKLKNIFYSHSSDSLFKPMMHRSDNFFAEQTVLMASNEHLGYMSDEKLIDTILNTDLREIPQKPKWVDGSGLSRYNLFTPQSFVYILNKMKNEFGLERLKNILPTGGEGTITAYYIKDAGYIFAKTGTLSNHCALSGFLITKKNKLLIFSILANNYQSGAAPVRRAVEKFLMATRERY